MQINIGLCINDSYSQHSGVLMASILSQASEEDSYKFYIVTDYISEDNRAKFEQLKSIKDFELEYIEVKNEDYENIRGGKHLHISQFYRLALLKLEAVDKLLYLDSDTICLHDIRELYETDIENYAMAGAEDIMGRRMKQKYCLHPMATYVNSGVLLLNLKETRKVDIFAILNNLPETFVAGDFGDQDIINHVFQDKILPVDIKWNYSYPFATTYFDVEYYQSIQNNPYIIHWITDIKPWKPNVRVAHKYEEYFKYLKLTPWNNKDFYIDYLIRGNTEIMSNIRTLLEHFNIPY